MGSIKTKDLTTIGYNNDQLRSLVIGIISKSFKHHSKAQLLTLLVQIKDHPEAYLDDPITNKIAEKILGKELTRSFEVYALQEKPVSYKIYGGNAIDAAAKKQMDIACQLPISLQGALMPDAHMGFGLPIGGVLATDNAVIPYAVGMDIGCRMALSIVDAHVDYLKRYEYQIKQALKNHTHFGMEGGLEAKQDHAILTSAVFNEIPFLKALRGKAIRQLGSSGSGNHFVDFGEIELVANNALGLPAKKYTALLTHSGSRGLGSTIARHYTQIALDVCKLPPQAQQLAWLDIDSAAGQEYWLAMELATPHIYQPYKNVHWR